MVMSFTKNQKWVWLLFGLYAFTALIYISIFFVNGNFAESTYVSFRRFESIGDDSQVLYKDTLAEGSPPGFFNPLLYYALYPLWFLSYSTSMFVVCLLLISSLLPLFIYKLLRKFENSDSVCILSAILASINPLIFLLITNGFIRIDVLLIIDNQVFRF